MKAAVAQTAEQPVCTRSVGGSTPSRCAILLFTLLLTGCALSRSLFVSGVSLEVVGNQFAAVSAQVTAGCATQVISVQTCERYRIFGEHFKRVYPLTVGLWEASRVAGDRASQGKAEEVIRGLSEDLTRLAIEALGTLAR